MQNFISATIAVIIVTLPSAALRADSSKTARDFRPLEAKKIVIAPAGLSGAADTTQGASEELLSSAWNHFDLQEWDQAIEKFLSVMEQDSKNASAAEGLAMSVYRTSDYKAAHRLSVEFASYLPDITEKIAGVVLSDVRSLISQGQYEAARDLLSNFPKSDLAFTHAHTLAEGAESLAQSIAPDDVMPVAGLARN